MVLAAALFGSAILAQPARLIPTVASFLAPAALIARRQAALPECPFSSPTIPIRVQRQSPIAPFNSAMAEQQVLSRQAVRSPLTLAVRFGSIIPPARISFREPTSAARRLSALAKLLKKERPRSHSMSRTRSAAG